ncbi:MAG TPA: hypothetical protein VNE62_06100 [Actinomycetota bacterium]|nr:hypothetical protein [Actinomycetota bacterium]
MLIGLAILVGFAALMRYMLQRTGLPDPEWSRSIYLYGTAEAVVFAAAGALFGREVNRQRAETAEDRAKSAETRADTEALRALQNTQDAAGGRALATAVRAEFGSKGAPDMGVSRGDPSLFAEGDVGTTRADQPSTATRLLRLAQALFPEEPEIRR